MNVNELTGEFAVDVDMIPGTRNGLIPPRVVFWPWLHVSEGAYSGFLER